MNEKINQKINENQKQNEEKIVTISTELYDVLLSLFTTSYSKLVYIRKRKEGNGNNDNNDFIYLVWKPGKWLLLFDPYTRIDYDNTYIPTWKLYSFKCLRVVYDSMTNDKYIDSCKLLYYPGDAKRYSKIFDPTAIQKRIENIIQYVSNKIFNKNNENDY